MFITQLKYIITEGVYQIHIANIIYVQFLSRIVISTAIFDFLIAPRTRGRVNTHDTDRNIPDLTCSALEETKQINDNVYGVLQ